MPVDFKQRRKVTMPNGKWTTRERTKAEMSSLRNTGKHDETTEQNDLDHIALIRTLPPNDIEDRRRNPRRNPHKPLWPAL